ncbi:MULTISPECIES: DUF6111 family protein [Stappiaceae]|uniref:Uncharacterized protein n=1 Tax=Roseibium polysiphoniae TaxID=2571221 RepID=A0ABR9C900_9HYPH|nr:MULTISPECIES: DUF6111 family protein [Stappiaceae]MBD8876053.1 hypothetical protein [Roseibium polysiphoniae]
MFRVVLSHMILFLLPFVGYAVWLWIKKKSQTSENWKNGPMAWLTLAGVLLVLISLVIFATFQKMPEGTEYRPSRMENGVFIPGGYE